MASDEATRIRLVPYDRTYLDRSWDWLHDPEIKALTLAPDFTREEQEAFFQSLDRRDDYKIWGVESSEGEPIGAAGLKKISGSSGEFWCYIGERSWWGRGAGGDILTLCEEKARDLGIDHLTMVASATNDRSIGLYQKMGFAPEPHDPTEGLVLLSKAVPQPIEVRRYTADLSDEWDRLIDGSRNGLFLFKRGYMDYHSDRFEDISALAMVRGKALAALPASFDRHSGIATSHGGLTFGGIVLDREVRGEVAIHLIDAMLDALRHWGASEVEIKLLPPTFATYPSGEVDYALWARGFSLFRRDLSSVLPLRESIPFNSSKKQAVAKASKAGLEVSTGDLRAFHELLTRVLGERHGVSPVHSLEEIELLAGRFPERILLRSIESEGEMIAGVLVYRYPNAWHTQYMAASQNGRQLGALDLVVASLIEEAREAGAQWFSFGTSTLDQGRTLNEGLLWQKESFGARSVTHDFVRGTL